MPPHGLARYLPYCSKVGKRGFRLGVNNRIKALREARGLSLDAVARSVGTTNQQISLLETGKRRLTVEWLQRLGEVLECHPWELVSDDLPKGLGRQEFQLLQAFQGLSDAQRVALLQLVSAIRSDDPEDESEEPLQGLTA